MAPREITSLAAQDLHRLVYELQVHQVELEMQNEALRVAQHDLERSQEQYHELFDSAPAGYVLVSAAGVIERANAAVLRLVRASRMQLVGKTFSSLVEDQDLSQLEEHLEGARWEKRATCEVHLRIKDAEARLVRLDITPVPSRSTNYLILLTDMSDRQRHLDAVERLNVELEARVNSRTAEVEARNRQLEIEIAARERAEVQRKVLEGHLREAQRLESLGLLAGGIAHDINNLLVGVLGNADLLLMEPGLPDDWHEPLEVIRSAGRKASDVTRQLNIFAGRGQAHTAPVSLPHLVANSLQQLRTLLSPRIQLLVQITKDLPAIEADRGQVHQLITNLITNAIEAVREESVIAISTRTESLSAAALSDFQHSTTAQPGQYAVLRVQDTGVGIPPENQDRIFDPFFTTKFTGRGLGLATVLGIVQSHRGALRVQTSLRGGTCFEVALPLARTRSDSQRAIPSNRNNYWTGTGRVLLIDDDDGVRSTMAALLKRMGFEVIDANSGEAGLDLHAQGDLRFDFVVLDWSMPGFSGEQVLAALRQRDAELPVVLISGYIAETLALDDPQLIRVQKPMTIAQLEDAIRTVTRDSVSKAPQTRTLRLVQTE
jgi:PAS domain S-box-containing protein